MTHRYAYTLLLIGAVTYAAWSDGLLMATIFFVIVICIYLNGFALYELFFKKSDVGFRKGLIWGLVITANSVLFFLIGLTPPLMLVWFPAIAGLVVAKFYLDR